MDSNIYPDEESLFSKLLDLGVLTEDDRDQYTVEESFDGLINDKEDHLSGLNDEEIIRELEGNMEIQGSLRKYINSKHCDESVIAEYASLWELEDLTQKERALVFTILDRFRKTSVNDAGAPDAFLPFPGERLPLLVQLYNRVIVYVWRDECEPCDVLNEDFDSIFSSPPVDIQLLAIYGPSNPELLYDLYQVDGAPITLFFFEGDVDVRLRKTTPQSAIKTEIGNLRERK